MADDKAVHTPGLQLAAGPESIALSVTHEPGPIHRASVAPRLGPCAPGASAWNAYLFRRGARHPAGGGLVPHRAHLHRPDGPALVNGPARRQPGEDAVRQLRDMAVARAGRPPSHDHGNQAAPLADGRESQVETGLGYVARLEPVGPGIAAQQTVVGTVCAPPELERFQGEVAVILWEIPHEGARQTGHVAGCGPLLGMPETRRIPERGAVHAELPGLAVHHPRELPLAAGDMVGDRRRHIVGRLDDERAYRVAHGDGRTAFDAEPGGRLQCRAVRDLHAGRELVLAASEPLEDEIEGHHLGQRCRITARRGPFSVEHSAAVGVHDNRSVARRWRGIGREHKCDQKQDSGNRFHGPSPADIESIRFRCNAAGRLFLGGGSGALP